MSAQIVPSEMFFTKGVGKHKHSLQSFEAALRDAGIAPFNLVTVSSIFPPNCKIVSRPKGVAKLKPGGIVHCVLAECRTNEPYRVAAAGIGLALPANRTNFGYISEYHGYGMNQSACEDHVEDMAASMLATTYGRTSTRNPPMTNGGKSTRPRASSCEPGPPSRPPKAIRKVCGPPWWQRRFLSMIESRSASPTVARVRSIGSGP
jgi:arginine decarboxylase